MLGMILKSHPLISVEIEKQTIFSKVTQAALNPNQEKRIFSEIIRYYRYRHFKTAPGYYGDKSHANLWLAEKIADTFSDALFIATTRDCYPVVASMLNYPVMLKWFDQWDKLPVPNRFLGITNRILPKYRDLSLAAKCALRWKAHHQEIKRLEKSLGDRFFVVGYEKLLLDTQATLASLCRFLDLKQGFLTPDIKIESLDKWRNYLSEKDIKDIDEILSNET